MKRRARPWGRILFNTLTAISLLLAIATAGLWVRSATVITAVLWSRVDEDDGLFITYYANAVKGKLFTGMTFDKVTRHPLPHPYSKPSFFQARNPDSAFWGRVLPEGSGFELKWEAGTPQSPTRRGISCPLWFPPVLFSLFPLARFILMQRKRHLRREGHCPACGYDTRANRANCSECGCEIAVGRES